MTLFGTTKHRSTSIILCLVLCFSLFSNFVLANEIYPSGKITKHIYGGDDRAAMVETVSGIKTPYYVHKDHLGESSIITDGSGNQVELIDYHPYGTTRLDQKAGSFESKYKFTGN